MGLETCQPALAFEVPDDTAARMGREFISSFRGGPRPKDTYSSSSMRELAKGRLSTEAAAMVLASSSKICPRRLRMPIGCASQTQPCTCARQETRVSVGAVETPIGRGFRLCDCILRGCSGQFMSMTGRDNMSACPQVGIDAQHRCEAAQFQLLRYVV